jgi:hypothetical protein
MHAAGIKTWRTRVSALHDLNQSRRCGQECPPYTCKQQSRPTVPCDGPRMNPSVDVGNPPRPFRHLRMTERRTPDPSSSRVPVHSALVQKSVTVITNPAGRLSIWMLGKSLALGKWKTANSWQVVCNQSNKGAGFRLWVSEPKNRPAGDGPFGSAQGRRAGVRPRTGTRPAAVTLSVGTVNVYSGRETGGSYERWVNETQRRRLVG